ncbi:MAG: 3-hydroxyacyl-CoA dehydrogenase NAD-binding domain-containing protein [Deltaproteobacteria bacterium]|nr:3-hydroxyacyl-CoA dehydrogenase NAD-binding domain-containing protein [Deltaproteobacteria bacterium]
MSEFTYSLDQLSSVATLSINTAGAVNTIGQRFLADMEMAIDRALLDRVKGVVIVSGKKKSFLDGANLKEIVTGATPAIIRHVTLRYQEALASLAKRPFPVVALLDGQTALGGGFELLIWACDHVFATSSSRMGFPEVNVGLFPAGGGTQILPKLIGLNAAVDLIANGRVNPAEYYSGSGFLTICTTDQLKSSAIEWIESHQGIVNRNYDPDFQESNPLSQEEKTKILTAAKSRYGISPYRPYVLAALDSMEGGLSLPIDAAAKRDIDLFVPLFSNPNSRNKIDLFGLVTGLAPKLVRVDPFHVVKVDKIAVIGSGLMGSGIAQVAAEKGINVTLVDVDAETAQTAVERIGQTLQNLVDRGKWLPRRREAALGNLGWTADYNQLKDIPLVIECVFEDLDLKQRIRAKVQEVNPNVIFASNTSTIPMAEISEGSTRPEMIVGMHFFSPAPLMPLLEVIRGPQSNPAVIATAVALGRAMGKTVILVNDGPGFYTSRTFGSYVMNGFRLAELGIPPWDVDLLALRVGFPQGPLHVYGTAGGNVIYHAGSFMATRFPDRMNVPRTLANMFEAGYVGAGKPSFYEDYRKMVPDRSAEEFITRANGIPTPTHEEAQDILILGMVNEAFWCMSEGVLRDYYSMDIGAVLGIGFPDCWHGPARYVSLKGVREVKRRLNELSDKFGMPGLAPAPEFDLLIATGLDSNLI